MAAAGCNRCISIRYQLCQYYHEYAKSNQGDSKINLICTSYEPHLKRRTPAKVTVRSNYLIHIRHQISLYAPICRMAEALPYVNSFVASTPYVHSRYIITAFTMRTGSEWNEPLVLEMHTRNQYQDQSSLFTRRKSRGSDISRTPRVMMSVNSSDER